LAARRHCIAANLFFVVPLRGVIICRFPRGGGVLSFASPSAGLRQIGCLKPGANRLTRLAPTGQGGTGAVLLRSTVARISQRRIRGWLLSGAR